MFLCCSKKNQNVSINTNKKELIKAYRACHISGSHGSDYEDNLLECHAV
jgi:hypothetical protein